MLALRKERMAASPPVLRGGFRPFFLAGAAWAVIALVLWLASFLGGIALPISIDPLAWHRHEMIFGFVGAVVVGFMLTAIPNWTGRLPLAGAPLAALIALWLTARVALLFSEALGLAAAAALDIGFYVIFAVIAGREVVAAKNRNLPLVVLVLLFGFADAIDYAGAAGVIDDAEAGFRTSIAIVVLMISVVGGRIIPSFTRNWMAKRAWNKGLPTQPRNFDQATLALTALALLAWVTVPSAQLTGIALLVAAALQLVRLGRWRGWRTLPDPLVLVLHIGYLWVPTGLLLLACTILGAAVPRTAAIHALTTGAMATMILAVMSRASLGHTGRKLKAGPATVGIFILITLAAILRVIAPLGLLDYQLGVEAAGASWASAFTLFLLAYGPILIRPELSDTAN
ncbi:MAG: NnrS family protein [Sphingomonadales bacterium]